MSIPSFSRRPADLGRDRFPARGSRRSSEDLRILPPPQSLASMAPEGYYLLFLVDSSGRVSVDGEFVKLTF